MSDPVMVYVQECECRHYRHVLGDECECKRQGVMAVDIGYGVERWVCDECFAKCKGPWDTAKEAERE